MLVFLVISLNLLSLAGIVLGLLLKSPVVRDAIEVVYIESDDIAHGRKSADFPREFGEAILAALLLNRKGHVGLGKVTALSFLSATVFWSGMFSAFGLAERFDSVKTGPIAMLVGGGIPGTVFAMAVALALAWPMHFVYDYLASRCALHIWRRSGAWRGATTLAAMVAAVIVLAVLPFAVTYGVFVLRYGQNLVTPEVLSVADWVIAGPMLMNGPTVSGMLAWVALWGSAKAQSGAWAVFSAGPIALILLSCALSFGLVAAIAGSRIVAGSPAATRAFASLVLKVSRLDADRIFSVAFAAFAIGNGLCQLFGISWQVR